MMLCKCVMSKLAGFVHKSFQNKTNQVILKKKVLKQIYDMGNLKPGFEESRFASPPVWIHKDSGVANLDY